MELKIKRKDRFPTLKLQLYKAGTTTPHNLEEEGTIYTGKVENGKEVSISGLKKHIFFIMKKTQLYVEGNNVLTNVSLSSSDDPLNTESYNIIIEIDDYDPLLIDVSGDAGVAGSYTPASIIDLINTAFSDIDISLASVASLSSEGKLRITSPSINSNSKVVIHNKPSEVNNNATKTIFGIENDTGDKISIPIYPSNPNLFNYNEINADIIGVVADGQLQYKWAAKDTEDDGKYIAEFKVKYFENITLLTGTIKLFQNSKTINGENTLFTKELKKGDLIKLSGITGYYEIGSVTDNTHAELSEIYDQGDTGSYLTASARVFKFQSFPNSDLEEGKLYINIIDDVDDDEDFYE
jgi:hypothetical protein